MATLTGCATASMPGPTRSTNPAKGNGTVGDVKIRGALLADVEGEPGAGVLVMGVVNEGADVDALTEVRVADEAGRPGQQRFAAVATARAVRHERGVAGAVYGGTYVLDGPPDRLVAGDFIPVSFTFRNAGSVTLDLLVLPASGDLATATPTASP